MTNEFWDRVKNPFIFSAIIATIGTYPKEFYMILTNDNWREAMDRINIFTWLYLGHLSLVLTFVMVSPILGELVSFVREFFTKITQHLLNKIQFETLSNSFKLKQRIDDLNKESKELNEQLMKKEAEKSTLTSHFLGVLDCVKNDIVKGELRTSNGKQSPYISDTTNDFKIRPASVFSKLKDGEVISFPIFFNFDNSTLVYSFKRPKIDSIRLGHKLLFTNFHHLNQLNPDWNTVYISEDSPTWTQAANKSRKFIMLERKGDFVHLSARLID